MGQPLDFKPFPLTLLAVAFNEIFGSEKIQTLFYVDRCYVHLSKAIDAHSYRDVVYVTYLLVIFEHKFYSLASSVTCIDHCVGMWKSLRILLHSSIVASHEMLRMVMLWMCAARLSYVQAALRGQHYWDVRFKYMYQFLGGTCSNVFEEKTITQFHSLLLIDDAICQRVHILAIYLQIYLDCYLVQRNHESLFLKEQKEFIETGLMSVLEQIIREIPRIRQVSELLSIMCSENAKVDMHFDSDLPVAFPHDPTFPSDNLTRQIWSLGLLYHSSILIYATLNRGTLSSHKKDAVSSAIALCPLVALWRGFMPAKESFERSSGKCISNAFSLWGLF